MARRMSMDQRTSRLALWARRVALFSLAAAALSVVIVHSGLLEIGPALVTFGASLALAVLALLLAFAGFMAIWKEGHGGIGASLGAIAIAMLLLAYPTFLAVKARNLPWIHDITTDPIDPPRYDTLARARPRDANSAIYAGLATAEQQLAAYPDLEPLDGDISPRSAYDAALAVINRRRYRVVEARPPDQGRKEGRIEAVARTPIMGFRDDVVVRVRPFEGGSRVDIRSSSRYGTFDFGANAARVRSLIEQIEAEFAHFAPDEPPPPVTRPKGVAKGTPKGQQKPAPQGKGAPR
jgi:uncharacterized protein (DUF1499 family)